MSELFPSADEILEIQQRQDFSRKAAREKLNEALQSHTPTTLMAYLWLRRAQVATDEDLCQRIWPAFKWDVTNPAIRDSMPAKLESLERTLISLFNPRGE